MAIVISKSLSLVDPIVGVDANSPIIGYDNVVANGTVSADSQNSTFPAVLLASQSTNERWESLLTTEQYVTITLPDIRRMDYLAIAQHNLGTVQAALSVEVLVETAESLFEYQEAVSPRILADDSPTIFRFDKQDLSGLRLKIDNCTAVPQIAVMYAGELLLLPRHIYVGHTPMKYGKQSKITNSRSESGQFLGRPKPLVSPKSS